MSKINREIILSWFLGFVVLWFGANEVLYSPKWVSMVPKFLGTGEVAGYLVILHGVILILCGLAFIFNFRRRMAAIVIVLMLLEIIFSLLAEGGLNPIAVRDIGLLGMALALTFRN